MKKESVEEYAARNRQSAAVSQQARISSDRAINESITDYSRRAQEMDSKLRSLECKQKEAKDLRIERNRLKVEDTHRRIELIK